MQASGNTNLQPSATDQYILVVNGKPQGPFSVTELKERKIKPGDFVKTPTMDDYKEAHEIAALRQLFGFNRQPLPMQYFGSFDQRATAAVIDWLLVLTVLVFVAFVVMLILLVALPGDDNKVLRIGISIGIMILTPFAKIAYNTKLESGPKRGTIGKQLMKIRVCDIYGEQVLPGQAFLRNLYKYISTATLFVGYLICFFNKKQQCLHDMLTDTVVIKDRLDG